MPPLKNEFAFSTLQDSTVLYSEFSLRK